MKALDVIFWTLVAAVPILLWVSTYWDVVGMAIPFIVLAAIAIAAHEFKHEEA